MPNDFSVAISPHPVKDNVREAGTLAIKAKVPAVLKFVANTF